MSRLRVACVGTGFIAGRHLSALSALPDVEVVAVADAVRERAEQVAAAHGARAYHDGRALLEQEELDAVWLCVPPFAHGPLELAAVERGLPFFVEKPLAVDLATAVEVAGRVGERGLTTAVGYHWRYLQVMAQAAELLRAAPAQLVTGSWLDRTPAAPWWRRRDRSGGQVLEQTTHLFDLVRVLAGEVDTVSAVEATLTRRELPDGNVPTASSCLLHFASGAVGTLSSSCLLGWRHSVGLQLVAPELVVELTERALTDHGLRVVTPAGERVVQSAQDPIAAEDRDFLAAVRGEGGGVRVPYAEALRTHALAWAADLSARQGHPVRPDSLLA